MCLSLKVRRDLEFTFACLPLLREVLTGQQQHSGLSVYQLRLVRILRWIRLDIVEIHGATLKLSGPTIFMMKFNFMWSWLRLILFRGINFTILQIAVNIWILAWAGLTRFKVHWQNIASRWKFLCSALHRDCALTAKYHCSVFKAKHDQVFSAALLNWCKSFDFFWLAVLWSDSMKQNSRRFTFNWSFNL